MMKFVRQFVFDRSGATVLLFAVTLLPAIAFLGGAIDFARALNVKISMQASLDAAMLAAKGWFGGGDAKLFAATSLWIGRSHLFDYVVVTTVIGGPLTFAFIAF